MGSNVCDHVASPHLHIRCQSFVSGSTPACTAPYRTTSSSSTVHRHRHRRQRLVPPAVSFAVHSPLNEHPAPPTAQDIHSAHRTETPSRTRLELQLGLNLKRHDTAPLRHKTRGSWIFDISVRTQHARPGSVRVLVIDTAYTTYYTLRYLIQHAFLKGKRSLSRRTQWREEEDGGGRGNVGRDGMR